MENYMVVNKYEIVIEPKVVEDDKGVRYRPTNKFASITLHLVASDVPNAMKQARDLIRMNEDEYEFTRIRTDGWHWLRHVSQPS